MNDARDIVRSAVEAMQALLDHNQAWQELAARQLEEFTVTTQNYRAENRRLLDALNKVVFVSPFNSEEYRIARDALAVTIE